MYDVMKIIKRTSGIVAGILFSLTMISCGNSNSTRETRDTTVNRSVPSPTDTFIQSDSDPRYQGIQGPQPVDSVRVQKQQP